MSYFRYNGLWRFSKQDETGAKITIFNLEELLGSLQPHVGVKSVFRLRSD